MSSKRRLREERFHHPESPKHVRALAWMLEHSSPFMLVAAIVLLGLLILDIASVL